MSPPISLFLLLLFSLLLLLMEERVGLGNRNRPNPAYRRGIRREWPPAPNTPQRGEALYTIGYRIRVSKEQTVSESKTLSVTPLFNLPPKGGVS